MLRSKSKCLKLLTHLTYKLFNKFSIILTSILCVLASPQYNLLLTVSSAMPFGQASFSDTNSTRPLPSKLALSIFGFLSFQSDQNISPAVGCKAIARGSYKSSWITTCKKKWIGIINDMTPLQGSFPIGAVSDHLLVDSTLYLWGAIKYLTNYSLVLSWWNVNYNLG